jgi:hypothetical protein
MKPTLTLDQYNAARAEAMRVYGEKVAEASVILEKALILEQARYEAEKATRGPRVDHCRHRRQEEKLRAAHGERVGSLSRERDQAEEYAWRDYEGTRQVSGSLPLPNFNASEVGKDPFEGWDTV